MSKHEKVVSTYNGEFCCEAMDTSLQKPEIFGLYYNKKFREYTVDVNGIGFKMRYCSSCGTKLPLSLRKEWFNHLEALLNTEITLDMDKSKIPKEFRSDVWWKKRNL